MVHLALHGRLNAEEVAWQDEARDLTPAVAQGLVTERPAFEQGEQVFRLGALAEHGRAGPGPEFTGLEGADEFQLLLADGVEYLTRPQGTLRARHVITERRERHKPAVCPSTGVMSKLNSNPHHSGSWRGWRERKTDLAFEPIGLEIVSHGGAGKAALYERAAQSIAHRRGDYRAIRLETEA